MSRKIIKKCYYRIQFKLKSPLAIGSGSNYSSDKDIIRDSEGRPYIPATAIAGIARSILKNDQTLVDAETYIKKYLGYVDINRGGQEKTKNADSLLIFYNGILSDDEYHTSIRDNVSLDEYKTAKKGAKFDMEILEPGVIFQTFIEQNYYDDTCGKCDQEKKENGNERDKGSLKKNTSGLSDAAGKCAAAFYSEEFLLGGKSMRGFGSIEVIEVSRKEFDFSIPGKKKEWLLRDVHEKEFWEENVETCKKKFENGIITLSWGETEGGEPDNNKCELGVCLHKITLRLNQEGGISIRRYTTKPSDGETAYPDMEQLTIKLIENGENKEVPVIPGTTWAGVIKRRMKELGMEDKDERDVFGYVDLKKKQKENDPKAFIKNPSTRPHKKSKLRFSESPVIGANTKILSRNAIDRFSGGTVDGKLFTEKTWYGGYTDLVISWHGKKPMKDEIIRILAAAITDLHFGFLAVGGETSIGRGLFSIEKFRMHNEMEKDENGSLKKKYQQFPDQANAEKDNYVFLEEIIREAFTWKC